jgi:tripartite ATP-independent transporter DctM subunit
MSLPVIGFIGIGVLILFFLLRLPVAFTMAIVGAAGYSIVVNPVAGLSLLGHEVFNQLSHYGLTVIPMFVLAGSIAFVAGLGDRLFGVAYAVAGKLPGSLAIASTAACAGFGAICGSSSATAASMGRIALPVMKTYNYDEALASGSIASAGTLAVLIPPSTVFRVYSILTNTSLGKMFLAGIIPGILLTSLFCATIIIQCMRNKSLAPRGPVYSRKEKMAGIAGIFETLILFLLVIGGLSLGWFSPTQGGGILAGGVLLMAVIRRQISWRGFIKALEDSARISCMIVFIMTGAIIFTRFMAVSRIPFVLAEWIGALPLNQHLIVSAIIIIYMIGGCFMDGMALVTLTMPIIFPTIQVLGLNPVWFGVMICVAGEMGMITPPVGICVYTIKGIAEDIPLSTIFRGVVPFIIAIFICLVALMAFPQIATFLPDLVSIY